MSKQDFLAEIRIGIERMRAAGPEITLVHHNDADGLSSAALLETAFTRAGFTVRRVCIERVHPPIIERIHAQFPSTIFYVDLGGQAAPAISEANRGQRTTIILDHHHPHRPSDPKVLNISTEFFGLSGDMDISASTAAYFFALELDAANRDLAYVGVLGAVGDEHDREGGLIKENREALLDAVEQEHIQIEVDSSGTERYLLTRFGGPLPMAPLAISVTTLGGVGYYSGGPDLGVRVCLDGLFPAAQQRLEELRQTQQQAYAETTARLKREGFRETEHIQWFTVGNDFSPMGVKIIGEYCWDIRNEDFVNPEKYIVGFQNMAPEIPGLGAFEWAQTKASMRLPTPLEHKVLNDRTMPGLAYLVPTAARQVGGSIDACHDYTAATIVDIGREEALVAEMDNLVRAKLSDG
ncbi:MAG TPA: DHH family phosphoesterase [Anaerolineales bacterium]|nr:DHH family phosphoesterase [Anaerolineales bacterium]